MSESGQLDLVAALRDQLSAADAAGQSMEDLLNPAIDANPNDKLLMEVFDLLTDAQESLASLGQLLDTMERRDESEGL